jgi:hypothetical protein
LRCTVRPDKAKRSERCHALPVAAGGCIDRGGIKGFFTANNDAGFDAGLNTAQIVVSKDSGIEKGLRIA